MEKINLHKKTAVITGSSKGIGKTIAYELAALGANVVIHYFMNENLAMDVCKDIENKYSVNAIVVQANLNDPKEIENMFNQIKDRFKHIDILINNAASGVHKMLSKLRLKDWDWTINVNGRGAFLCIQEAAKLMDNNKTSYIVNITSMGSQRVLPEYGVVGCSKAIIETLTRYSAFELADKNIVVNTVAGGVVETEALESFPHGRDLIIIGKKKTPAGRLTSPQDIANVIAFLVSGYADMIRGQILVVDGGYNVL